MHLEATILIHRTPEQVWTYLGDVSNVPRWDRGVASVKTNPALSPGVGFEFDTLAHPKGADKSGEWGKMSYRIAEADPASGCTVRLTSSSGNARFFKTAEWRWRVDPVTEGSLVTCTAHFSLRFPYSVLAPVFFLMKRGIQSDLKYLKQKLENDGRLLESTD
jgi:uncharacterized protein YndB with AHSA1/START domain